MDIRQEIREDAMQEGIQKGLQTGRQEGLQAGRQEGLQKGMQAGMQKGMQAVALNMLKNKFKLSVISEMTGLSEDQINRLKNDS